MLELDLVGLVEVVRVRVLLVIVVGAHDPLQGPVGSRGQVDLVAPPGRQLLIIVGRRAVDGQGRTVRGHAGARRHKSSVDLAADRVGGILDLVGLHGRAVEVAVQGVVILLIAADVLNVERRHMVGGVPRRDEHALQLHAQRRVGVEGARIGGRRIDRGGAQVVEAAWDDTGRAAVQGDLRWRKGAGHIAEGRIVDDREVRIL